MSIRHNCIGLLAVVLTPLCVACGETVDGTIEEVSQPFVRASYDVAFQSNAGTLRTSRIGDTQVPMMIGTSPSFGLGSNNNNDMVAFQGSNGQLWTLEIGYEGLHATDRGVSMMGGTSPSATATAAGPLGIVFQSSTGSLRWNIDWGLGMMTGTSPSVTSLAYEGGSAVAFQANTGVLWILTLTNSSRSFSTGLGMMIGTSPSIAAMPDGGYGVAFQSNTGTLWVGGTIEAFHDTGLGMMRGTSPSIAALPGGRYAVAFQANTGTLWVGGTSEVFHDTGLGMMRGTSPSITALPGGGYAVAFQANTGTLWVGGTGEAFHETGLGMMSGTSPSIGMPSPPAPSTVTASSTAESSSATIHFSWTGVPGTNFYHVWGTGLGLRIGYFTSSTSIDLVGAEFSQEGVLYVQSCVGNSVCSYPQSMITRTLNRPVPSVPPPPNSLTAAEESTLSVLPPNPLPAMSL
jgi:hypothetical protein